MATWLLMAILPFQRQLRSARRATANEQARAQSARRPMNADQSDFSLKGQVRPPFILLGESALKGRDPWLNLLEQSEHPPL